MIILLLICLSCWWYFPLHSWDSRSFWALTAKYYVYHSRFEYDDPHVYHPAPHYPKLIPILMAWMCRLTGGYSERAVKSVSYILFWGLAAYLLINFNIYTFILLITIPGYYNSSTGSLDCAVADIPLGTFYTIGVVSMLQGHTALSCLFLALCLLCKQEGIPLTLIALGCAVVMRLEWWWYILPFSVLLLPKSGGKTYWTKKRFKAGLGKLGKLPKILQHTFQSWGVDFLHYGIFWYILAAKIITDFHRSPYLIIPLVYYFCILVPIYVALDPPYDIAIEWKDTSQPRLMFHVLPLLCIYIGGA